MHRPLGDISLSLAGLHATGHRSVAVGRARESTSAHRVSGHPAAPFRDRDGEHVAGNGVARTLDLFPGE